MTLYALFYRSVCNCKHIKIVCIKFLVLFVVYILTYFYMPDSNGSLNVPVQQKLNRDYFNIATQTKKGNIFGR